MCSNGASFGSDEPGALDNGDGRGPCTETVRVRGGFFCRLLAVAEFRL